MDSGNYRNGFRLTRRDSRGEPSNGRERIWAADLGTLFINAVSNCSVWAAIPPYEDGVIGNVADEELTGGCTRLVGTVKEKFGLDASGRHVRQVVAASVYVIFGGLSWRGRLDADFRSGLLLRPTT